MTDVVDRDGEHELIRTRDEPPSYAVTTHTGRLVGVVEFTPAGWRCWRDGRPTLVPNAHRVLPHYRS